MSRFLIVGAGNIARRHANNLRALVPAAHILVLPSVRSVGSIEFADQSVSSIAEALTAPLHGAIIASPSSTHLAYLKELLSAGIHTLVEKPLSHSDEGISEVSKILERCEAICLVGYHLRFSSSLRAFKRSLEQGIVGKLVCASAEVGQYLPDWRPGKDYTKSASAIAKLGGGALLELSHELDYIQWLFGDVHAVQGIAWKSGTFDIDVEDCVNLIAEFGSGLRVQVHLDMIQRHPTRVCRVVGSEGTLVWDGISHIVTVLANGATKQVYSPALLDKNQMYLEEMRHFLQCAQGAENPLVTFAEGVQTLRLIAACRQASESGEKVILSSLRGADGR